MAIKLTECRYTFNIFSLVFLTADQGDFDPELHNVAFVSEFRFVANQNEQFENDVLEQFSKLK